MTSFGIATAEALLIVRSGSAWTVEVHLSDQEPEALAVDPSDPARLYAGTRANGLFRSLDAGRTWDAVGEGLAHTVVSAVAVGFRHAGGPGPVYAGTSPSSLARSDDGGTTWRPLEGLLALPSASRWSFPPKPETHHVRWIEIDPLVPDRVCVAIEAGALVRSPDGGATWLDRVPGGPIDTNTAATHRQSAGWLYSAAGDGYFESRDGGASWRRPMAGLRHGYLVGVAVDPGNPETVVVSAVAGPYVAYQPEGAEGYVYRKTGDGPFVLAMVGLSQAHGTVASRLASQVDEPGAFYAANHHGLFRSLDAGITWTALEVDWPAGVFRRGVRALVVLVD